MSQHIEGGLETSAKHKLDIGGVAVPVSGT
jgi:hypothetical protein